MVAAWVLVALAGLLALGCLLAARHLARPGGRPRRGRPRPGRGARNR